MRLTLQVKPGDFWRAHAEKRKAALVVTVNQLFRWRFGLRQNAEPAKGIEALEHLHCLRRNGRTADTVKAVTARNEITLDFLRFALVAKADLRRVSLKIVNAGFFDFKI